WDFPDSLQKLPRRDDLPFVQVVLEGKVVPEKPVAPKDDPSSKTLANATVDAYVAGDAIQVTVDGMPARIKFRNSSRFFDAAGKEVPAAQASKVHRVGNIVTIKARFEFNSDIVVEMRL